MTDPIPTPEQPNDPSIYGEGSIQILEGLEAVRGELQASLGEQMLLQHNRELQLAVTARTRELELANRDLDAFAEACAALPGTQGVDRRDGASAKPATAALPYTTAAIEAAIRTGTVTCSAAPATNASAAAAAARAEGCMCCSRSARNAPASHAG